MTSIRVTLSKRESTIGAMASGMAVVMFISLIEILVSNIQGNSSIVVQPAATAVNGFFWCLYAFIKRDRFLMVPNVLAMILGAATVAAAVFPG